MRSTPPLLPSGSWKPCIALWLGPIASRDSSCQDQDAELSLGEQIRYRRIRPRTPALWQKSLPEAIDVAYLVGLQGWRLVEA